MRVLEQLETITRRPEIGLALDVYKPETLQEVVTPIESYLAAEPAPAAEKRGLFGLGRRPEPRRRVAPLLLTGPVGTGKTTLMLLLDRAIGGASCAPLFQQEIEAHPSTADDGAREMIEIHPLALMGQRQTLLTGVIRLRELQTFYRLYTYDRRTASVDSAAAQQFARFFQRHVLFIDEFVPDVVTSFPMQVVNHLADHGVLVVLSSNRNETPFVPGVQVVRVEGEDMRVGTLTGVVRPAGVEPLFDSFAGQPATQFDFIARGLQGRVGSRDGRNWLHMTYPEFARVPADWAAFQKLLQYTDGVLIDQLPLFNPEQAGGMDGARRFVFLIDALYDERRPVRVRLTNSEPLPERFDVDTLHHAYLPEILLDLERALSRLRQLSNLL